MSYKDQGISMKSILLVSRSESQLPPLLSALDGYQVIVDDLSHPHPITEDISVLILDSAVVKEARNLILECRHRQIPSFLTWFDEKRDLRTATFDGGFSDFLVPPFYQSVVSSKIKTHINISEMVRSYSVRSAPPVRTEEEHHQELLAVQDAAILCLASVARVRDHSTGNHILRTQHYVKALAEHLRYHPEYAHELDDDETIELFYKTASLHDIGKVGIPDSILQKPATLTDDEYELMKKHTVFGYQAIHSAELLLERETKGKAAKFLKIAQQVTLSHHERWDGTGYPQGLKGESIPIVARLMAVADVYDAIISRRPYKEAQDHIKASTMILEGSGTLFDPNVVKAFDDLQETFDKISYILEDYFPSQSDLTLHSLEDLL